MTQPTNHRWTLMNTDGSLGDICPVIRVYLWFTLSCFRGSYVGFQVAVTPSAGTQTGVTDSGPAAGLRLKRTSNRT